MRGHRPGFPGRDGFSHPEARMRGFGWRFPGPFGPLGPPHGRGGGRGRRANVRGAVLALLAERPMHGYEMITELESRTQGVWRPSPGSVYPTLQLLEDEGLIVSETSGGRKRFSLTEAGRAEAEGASGTPPWEEFNESAFAGWHDLRDSTLAAMNALRQVMMAGTDEQRRRAVEVIDEAKRKLYTILAES